MARDPQRILLVGDPEGAVAREGIVLGHYADDFRGLPVDAHGAADDRGVGVEALAPEFVGEDDDRRRALDRVTREDGAPELGRDAGHVENVAVGEGAVVALRLTVAGEVGRADVDAAEGLEAVAGRFADLLEVSWQHRVVIVAGLLAVDRDNGVEAFRVRVRRRLQHQRVGDAVHEDHRAEAEAQHARRQRREARRAAEARDGRLQLVDESTHG